jgi:hypothetical protein
MSEQETSTEVTEIQTDVPGGTEEMAAKKSTAEMKGRKRKDTAQPQAKSREKKVPLKVAGPKDVTVKQSKYVTTATKGEKRIWLRGSTVGLTHRVTGLKGFKQISAEDAKKNHLGKTRMLGKVNSQEELDDLITKFFA